MTQNLCVTSLFPTAALEIVDVQKYKMIHIVSDTGRFDSHLGTNVLVFVYTIFFFDMIEQERPKMAE